MLMAEKENSSYFHRLSRCTFILWRILRRLREGNENFWLLLINTKSTKHLKVTYLDYWPFTTKGMLSTSTV